MGLKVRSEISRRKEHWLPKHRQLELVHFDAVSIADLFDLAGEDCNYGDSS